MDDWGGMETELRALRVHDAPADRVESIRERCVAGLAATRSRSGMTPSRLRVWALRLEPAVACGLCALYLAAVFGESLALLRR